MYSFKSSSINISPYTLKGDITNGNVTVNGGFRGVEISDGDSDATVTAASDEPSCMIADAALVQQDGAAATSTSVFGNSHASYSVLPVVPAQLAGQTPQGRLTLVSGKPVMVADAVGQTTVYYAPYTGSRLPIYNGVQMQLYQFTASATDNVGLSLLLGSSYQTAGNLYDLYVGLNGGAVTLCTGPAWTNQITRAVGVQLYNGIWTNAASISCRYGTTSGVGTITCAINACTYVGTMYATANGETGVQFGPNNGAGGPTGGNVIGIWNAYNRVRTTSYAGDTSSLLNANTAATWEPYHARLGTGGLYNRVIYIDGLQQTSVEGSMTAHVSAASGTTPQIGICIDSSTCSPTQPALNFIAASGRVSIPYEVSSPPLLGENFFQSMEYNSSNSSSALDFGPESLRLMTEY